MAQANGRISPDARSVEYAKCAADVAYFTDTYGVIDDAQGAGDGSGQMRFALWPAQAGVLWQFMAARMLIILKARQLGISWLCCSYALWHCLFAPGKVVLCLSKGQSEANELIRRILVLYERLPEWLRDALPPLRKSNTSLLEWGNESRILSLPATEGAGRSFTGSLVILDEAAFLQWGRAIYTALKPCIDGGGQLIILSTANGLGNLFHLLWTKAVAGHNSFQTIFLPWSARPGRDAAWYARQVAEATDPAMVKQEYPASPQEAFVASGRTRFESAWIEAQTVHARSPLPVSALPLALRAVPGLCVYRLPEPGHKYILAADVAEGLAHGDFDAALLFDADTWEECASLHGHWEPDAYADSLQCLGEAYGAEILPERNNHGHAVLVTLKLKRARRVASGLDDKPGWLTNVQTKPLSIDALAEALRDGLIKLHTPAVLDELQIYKILDNGKTGAPESYHDDFVMAAAIGIAYARSGMRRKAHVY